MRSSFGLAGKLVFRVDDRTGRLHGHLKALSGSASLNEALERAVKAADSAGRFGPLTPETWPRDGDVELYVRELFEAVPDGVMLMRVRFKAIRIDSSITEPVIAPYKFPAGAAPNNAEDDVVVQFVVDEEGKMDPRTFRVVQATFREFADAAEEHFLRSRFTPARVGACPVRSMLTYTINYRLTYRPDAH